MRFKKINIDYWTLPDGDDFKDIDQFSKSISYDYFLSINKKRGDGLGGGFYDLVVKVTEDISLLDLAKSYTEDGVKILIGFTLKSVFNSVKDLFKRNESLQPSIEEIVLDFKDCKIRIYNLLQDKFEDIFDDLMIELFEFRLQNKKFFKQVRTIHIPIVNQPDWYNICDYRVILNVDEPIRKFSKDIYFGYWGISSKRNKHVYDVQTKRLFEQKFYTQKTYDRLFNEAYDKGKLNPSTYP